MNAVPDPELWGPCGILLRLTAIRGIQWEVLFACRIAVLPKHFRDRR